MEVTSFDPVDYINDVILDEYNLGDVIRKIHLKKKKDKNPDPYVYFDSDQVDRIINYKYPYKQLKDLYTKHKDFKDITSMLGAIAGWLQDRELITIEPYSKWYKDLCDLNINDLDHSLSALKQLNLNSSDIFKLPYKQFFISIPWDVKTGDKRDVGYLISIEFNYDYISEDYIVTGDIYYNLAILEIYYDTKLKKYVHGTLKIPLLFHDMYDNIIEFINMKKYKLQSQIDYPDELNSEWKNYIARDCVLILLILKHIINDNIANHNISVDSKNEPSNHTKDEIKPWDVTSRKGETIGPKEATKTTAIDDDEDYEFVIDPKTYRDYPETHQPPRPHMRRGHAHNYWYGSGENKHLEERWIKPIEVNHVDRIGPDQMPVVFHDTTDK